MKKTKPDPKNHIDLLLQKFEELTLKMEKLHREADTSCRKGKTPFRKVAMPYRRVESEPRPVCPFCFGLNVVWHDDGYCFCDDCQAIWNRYDYDS